MNFPNSSVAIGSENGRTRTADLPPDGRAHIGVDQAKGSWNDLRNFFAGKTNGAQLTIEELGDAIAEAGAAAGLSGIGEA